MKRSHWLYLPLLMLTAPALAATGNVNVLLGQKNLDNGDWNSPYDDQAEFGILFDIGDESWPVSIAVDVLGSARSTEDSNNVEHIASTSELDFGARKVFDIAESRFHPYIGAGLALITVRLETKQSSGNFYQEEGGVGGWASGGVYVTLGQHFNLGLDLRYSTANVTIAGTTVDAGGRHAGLLLGYHW